VCVTKTDAFKQTMMDCVSDEGAPRAREGRGAGLVAFIMNDELMVSPLVLAWRLVVDWSLAGWLAGWLVERLRALPLTHCTPGGGICMLVARWMQQ